MPIKFNKEKNEFTLTTKRTKYVFDVKFDRYLVHEYYGKKTGEVKHFEPHVVSFAPYRPEIGNGWSPDVFPQEYSFFGSGDFRTAAIKIRGADGSGVTDFAYKSYKIKKNAAKPDVGVPYSRVPRGAETLEVELYDDVNGCALTLSYTVYYDEDVITRHASVENRGVADIKIEKMMSMTLDLPSCAYDMVSLYGGHFWERYYQRVPLHHGMQSVASRRGASSHQYNPFIAFASKNATEARGDVYGVNLVWSGSFLDEAEVDQTGGCRVQTGLGEENFVYKIAPGESFTSPEAVLTFSSSGFGMMTSNFHDFTRRYILPEKSVASPHPVVLNTWEGCFFNIDEEKLVAFAEESAKVGVDMLVMDDGWFGKRYSDWAALGDWYPNPERFKNGLAAFVKKVKEKGVAFGIWIEPEMVNRDSDLYRAHPEWALSVPGREALESRQQLVLDMANPDVVEYLKKTFSETFDGVPIDYFKWDANRHLTDVYSPSLPADRQDEVPYRFMKGVYELLRWFGEKYPKAVIETCAGGGGRYDLAMMTYGFQIWASDNTHPYDRLWLQSTDLLAYPACTMSCHVSNPQGSVRSLDYRYKVACAGMLGYEFNILAMSDEIKSEMARQIKDYKTFERVVRLGVYHSLVFPFEEDYSAYYYSFDGEILFTLLEKENTKARTTKPLKIKSANAEKSYVDRLSGKRFTGRELKDGLRLELTGERDTATLMYLVEE